MTIKTTLTAPLRSGAAKPAKLKALIRKALDVVDYVDYEDAREVIERAGDAGDLIQDVLESGNACSAAELAAYALELGFKAINCMDDSSGNMGDLLSAIAGVHLEACEKGGLSAVELAYSVFDLQLADDIGIIVLEPYRATLGKEGLAAYRKLVRNAWNKLPVLTQGAQVQIGSRVSTQVSTAHYAITAMMKTLALIDGDVDALIDILKHDLRHAHNYLKIAETLAQADRHDEALQWVEDGRKIFPAAHHTALDDFAAAEYHRRGRHDDAIALHWMQFEKHPALQNYQMLKASADKNQTWNAWREKALAHMEIAARKNSTHSTSWLRSDGSTLIEIHLWEGNPASALVAARTHKCTRSHWLELAKALERGKPDEAICIYQKHIDSVITGGDKGAYHAAGQLIVRLCKLMHAAQRQPEYTTYLAGVRLRHKAKRNFIKVLDALAAKKKV